MDRRDSTYRDEIFSYKYFQPAYRASFEDTALYISFIGDYTTFYISSRPGKNEIIASHPGKRASSHYLFHLDIIYIPFLLITGCIIYKRLQTMLAQDILQR